MNVYASRAESHQRLAALQNELQTLNEERKQTEAMMGQRQRQFSLLLQTIQELKSVFAEDAEGAAPTAMVTE